MAQFVIKSQRANTFFFSLYMLCFLWLMYMSKYKVLHMDENIISSVLNVFGFCSSGGVYNGSALRKLISFHSVALGNKGIKQRLFCCAVMLKHI